MSFCETCEQCGQRKSDVELQIDPDPYQSEINDSDEMMWLCNECVETSNQEI